MQEKYGVAISRQPLTVSYSGQPRRNSMFIENLVNVKV